MGNRFMGYRVAHQLLPYALHPFSKGRRTTNPLKQKKTIPVYRFVLAAYRLLDRLTQPGNGVT